MNISQKGIDLIKSFERFSGKAYKLAGESYYTIGYGHSYDSSITASTVWTQAHAEIQLKKDLARFEAYVTQYAKQYHFTFNVNQFSALVSYCYNRGQGGLKELLSHSKTIADVSKNIIVYWGSAERYKNGLLNRRKKEKVLFDTAIPKAVAKSVYHVVISGDTVSALAKHFGSSVTQIKTWNKLNDKYVIHVNQKLRVK